MWRIVLLVLLLAGCVPNQTANRRLSIVVQNQCTGPNQVVYLYVNSEYWGTVQGSRAITDLAPGIYNLRAVGTKAGALTFSRRLDLVRDAVWTLCL